MLASLVAPSCYLAGLLLPHLPIPKLGHALSDGNERLTCIIDALASISIKITVLDVIRPDVPILGFNGIRWTLGPI